MKKRLAVALVSGHALVGLGTGLAPAKAAPKSPVPTTVNVTAPACTELYILIRLGYCWHGFH